MTGEADWFRRKKDVPEESKETSGREKSKMYNGGSGKPTSPGNSSLKSIHQERTVRIASPLFIPPTKDSILLNKLKAEDEKIGDLVG